MAYTNRTLPTYMKSIVAASLDAYAKELAPLYGRWVKRMAQRVRTTGRITLDKFEGAPSLGTVLQAILRHSLNVNPYRAAQMRSAYNRVAQMA